MSIRKAQKLQRDRNLIIRQLRQKLKEEKAKQIEKKDKYLEQLLSNPPKMCTAI